MSVHSDNNVAAKSFAKLSKYKYLAIEVEMWRLKAMTILVVVGALGLMKKDTNAFFEKFPGSPLLQEVQKNDPEKYSSCLKRNSLTVNFFFSIIFFLSLFSFFFLFLSFCTKSSP